MCWTVWHNPCFPCFTVPPMCSCPMRSHIYCPDILWYQVTDLTWLRYHAHLAEFGYRGYLIDLFGSLRQHIRLVWSRHGYSNSTASFHKTNHGSTKLALNAAEAKRTNVAKRHDYYDESVFCLPCICQWGHKKTWLRAITVKLSWLCFVANQITSFKKLMISKFKSHQPLEIRYQNSHQWKRWCNPTLDWLWVFHSTPKQARTIVQTERLPWAPTRWKWLEERGMIWLMASTGHTIHILLCLLDKDGIFWSIWSLQVCRMRCDWWKMLWPCMWKAWRPCFREY